MITKQEIEKFLSYNPDTGLFTRVVGGSGVGNVAGAVAGTDIHARGKTYKRITISGKKYFAHRLAVICLEMDLPESCVVDHINGDGTCNISSNLRVVSASDNAKNIKLQDRSVTGVIGVIPRGRAFEASIGFKGKCFYLGRFKDLESAKLARSIAEKVVGYMDEHGDYR